MTVATINHNIKEGKTIHAGHVRGNYEYSVCKKLPLLEQAVYCLQTGRDTATTFVIQSIYLLVSLLAMSFEIIIHVVYNHLGVLLDCRRCVVGGGWHSVAKSEWKEGSRNGEAPKRTAV